MSSIVIVPNALRDKIYASIDAELAKLPSDAAVDREFYFGELLAYFDEHGTIPEFSIAPKATS